MSAYNSLLLSNLLVEYFIVNPAVHNCLINGAKKFALSIYVLQVCKEVSALSMKLLYVLNKARTQCLKIEKRCLSEYLKFVLGL